MLPTVPDPTTGEWVAAAIAACLVVVLGALLLLGPALRRSTATSWGRAGGLLLAITASGLVLVVAVAFAGSRAGRAPVGEFAGVLVHSEPGTAGRIAGYVAALLLPLAAVLAVLAVAVVDIGRPSGLRAAAGAAAGFVLVAGAVVTIGDTGPAPTAVGSAAVVLAAATILALALDEVLGDRQSSRSPAPESDASTISSQRSLQSRQR